MTEIFAAGWTAAVDGKRSRVIPVNVAFRGVPLLAGTHRVELRYNPPGFKIGAGISLMSLLILLGLFVRRETSEVRDA